MQGCRCRAASIGHLVSGDVHAAERAAQSPCAAGAVGATRGAGSRHRALDLTLELIDADEHLEGWLEYSTDLFEPATVARMAAHLQTLLAAIVVAPGSGSPGWLCCRQPNVGRSSSIGTTPRHRFPAARHFLRPVRPAGRAHAGCRCRFRRAGSSQLPRARAPKPAIADRLVARVSVLTFCSSLLAERSVDFLAAMIAVQSAGGAFLPLDPSVPSPGSPRSCDTAVRRWCWPGKAAPRSSETCSRKSRPECARASGPRRGCPGRATQRRSPGAAGAVEPRLRHLHVGLHRRSERRHDRAAWLAQPSPFTISDLALSAADVVAQTAPQSFVISDLAVPRCPDGRSACPYLCRRGGARPGAAGVIDRREGVTVLQIVPALLRAILDRAPDEPAFRALRADFAC